MSIKKFNFITFQTPGIQTKQYACDDNGQGVVFNLFSAYFDFL